MSPYMKKFVYASLFYLLVAAVFGILDGLLDLGYFGSFAHTHFSLLGFMAMIVFGIGYFILPRFNGTDLRFESWVPVHFWLANVSLVGMVIFRGLSVGTGQDLYHLLFIICAAIQVVSIVMFVINIWISLTPRKVGPTVENRPQRAPAPGSFEVTDDSRVFELGPDTRVADLVDALPSLKETLIEQGLRPLAMPGHIDVVREKGVPLGRAAANHGIDFDSLVKVLREQLGKAGFKVVEAERGGVKLASSTLIGEIIRDHPETRDVFQKHFGSGCFDCPGQAYESIDMACRMHGVNPDEFLRELNRTVK